MDKAQTQLHFDPRKSGSGQRRTFRDVGASTSRFASVPGSRSDEKGGNGVTQRICSVRNIRILASRTQLLLTRSRYQLTIGHTSERGARRVIANLIVALLISLDVILLVRTVRRPARTWRCYTLDSNVHTNPWSSIGRLSGERGAKVLSQNRIEGGPHGGCPTLDARAVAQRKSVRSLLARPFYWLGLVSVVFLLIFLWSAEHVEGVSANDLE